MNWWQRTLKWVRDYTRPDMQLMQSRAPVSSVSPVAPAAGRVSLDSAINYAQADKAILPPPDYEGKWRFHDLDTKHLDVLSPMEVMNYLLDISPDVSRAAWDFNRLCNPGWVAKAYRLGTGASDSPEGQAWLDGVWETLERNYGSPDIIINRYFMGAFMGGGFCGEIVLDGEARETVDLVAPDPFSIRFRKVKDPVRGEVWQPGQMQRTRFVPLDIPTFAYLPVDPAPASPYGRSLAAPALFTSLFILSVLHDVKRVIMQQGYKRMDIVLNSEQAMDSFSYDPQGYASLGEYMRAAMDAVKDAYRKLQPDEAFLHTDLFTLSVPVGTIDSDSIGAIDKIILRMEKRAARALKSNSLLMDMDNSTSETDSNRRWEIHAAGIKSLQHLCENMLESLLTVGAQARGIQCRIEFRFAEMRAAEMFRDEQTMAMRIQNARQLHAAGYVSQNEASNYAIGHDADQEEPREAAGKATLQEDNSSGNENLKQGEDERVVDRVLNRLLDILKTSDILEREAPGNWRRNGHG